MSAPSLIKGWCPGALRPMQSGDGLIVRIRPYGGSLPVASLGALADAASRFGNGQIDLTRRANLQIRGVTEAALAPLWDALAGLGLLDDSAEAEAIRNIAVNPLAGIDPAEIIDVRPIAEALASQLAAHEDLQALPGKFAFVIDGGGLLPLTELAADVRVEARRDGADVFMAVGVATTCGVTWLAAAAPSEAADVAVQVARTILRDGGAGRARALPPQAAAAIRSELGLPDVHPNNTEAPADAQPRRGLLALRDERYVVGLGAAFGRIDGGTLATLAEALTKLNVTNVRLSPWRALYAAVDSRRDGEALIEMACMLGLVIDDADPLVRIDACSGAGCCNATGLPTRDHARLLALLAARTGFAGTVHVSGCLKGCARSAPADLVLIGDGDSYRVVRNGTIRDEPVSAFTASEIETEGIELLTKHTSAHA
jgi:precorrin-3B synthase